MRKAKKEQIKRVQWMDEERRKRLLQEHIDCTRPSGRGTLVALNGVE